MPIDIATGAKPAIAQPAPRSWKAAIRHGLRLRCPNCGQGRMFNAFLKVNATCPHCGERLDLHKADDAPPYFTITIVAHIVIPLLLWVEKAYAPPEWLHAVIWLPLCLILSLLLLPRVKGALIAVQWAARMHGFGAEDDESAPLPP